ncbi:MAG: SCO family protein, partial [Gammaproteobacteria bacterium]|nr:SCO family protein [Gammaproteobacteria bacterium]
MKWFHGFIAAASLAAGSLAVTAVAATGHDVASHGAPGQGTAGHDAGAHANHAPAPQFDEKSALAISQAAVGKTLENLELRGTDGKPVRLAELRGKPLVVSLIYTSCYHICPTTTKHLAKVAAAARAALGPESFRVITVGFDTRLDNPAAMQNFAKQQNID